MNIALGRRLLAEAVGTALLVVFGAGAVVAALATGEGQIDYAGLGIVALSFALVIASVIYMFGTTSGAHINPAVTVSLAVVRRFPWVEVVPYIAAQLLGAITGALLVNSIFGSQASDLYGSGTTVVGSGFTQSQAVVAEGLGTFLLMATIMALAIDRRAPVGFGGLVIGLAVACEIMVIGPISGGSVNPARTFGPDVATSIFGGSVAWGELWIYCAGPLIGAVIAALAYVAIAQPGRDPDTVPDAQGTGGGIEGHRVLAEQRAGTDPDQRSTTTGENHGR